MKSMLRAFIPVVMSTRKGNMMNTKFTELLANAPEMEPDEIDREMLTEAVSAKDQGYIPKEEYEIERNKRVYNGKIALRIPKTLHQDLIEAAKKEGVSLNQYCLYKLAQ